MNSALNPEAPEFYPHITSATQDGYTSVNKSIRCSNLFPSGSGYRMYKTMTDFNILIDQLSENVILQAEQIVTTELPAVKLKRNENEFNEENIINANDCLIDRVYLNIDSVTGANKPDDTFLAGINSGIASWNKKNNAVVTKIQVGTATFIGGKNIPRPQLLFKDPIDNSDSLWVPRISDKPNNIKPLALKILYNDEGEAVGYEHPYLMELELYQPPEEFVDPDPEAPTFPPPLSETSYTYVDTEAKVNDLVNHLNDVKEIAVDVEHHSYRTYQGITCIIQITTNEGGDFIIDALAVREHIHKLNLAFTDPKKIKVFHGAEMDVLWLQRDFGVYLVGLFDTHQAAKILKEKGLSLKYLLMKYCGVDADKKYQLADWRIRPLPEDLVEYARMDTHYLLYIWRRLKSDLLELASGRSNLLLAAFEQSRQICGMTYNKEVVDDSSHLPLYMRSKKSFNAQQLAALQLLYKWRDAQARELDESTSYILPNHMLMALAETLPREVQGVDACCSPMPPFVKQNIITIHRMILSCRELPMEPQLYQMPTSVQTMAPVAQPRVAYILHDLPNIEYTLDNNIPLERVALLLEECGDEYVEYGLQTEIPAFVPNKNEEIVSDLNVYADHFVPPYDRYKAYRSVAQKEELKEFKKREEKVAALSKGNQLIQNEVLLKLQQAREHLELEVQAAESAQDSHGHGGSQKTEKRKRKISDKSDRKEAAIETKNIENSKNDQNNKRNKDLKPFPYKNVNYKKFYNNTEKAHKQPKMKFKKHK